MRWIQDDEFIRGEIPMTKFEVRCITMAMLDLQPQDTLLDVGAGTGSICVQAALMGATSYGIETKAEGIALIQQNAQKFGVTVKAIEGTAPQAIDQIPTFNKCFVGGSKGKLELILEKLHERLPVGGKIVGNFIIPQNMVTFLNCLKSLRYQGIENRLIQASNSNRLGMMIAQNPVYILGGTKP